MKRKEKHFVYFPNGFYIRQVSFEIPANFFRNSMEFYFFISTWTKIQIGDEHLLKLKIASLLF
jgi:hypothetical protein